MEANNLHKKESGFPCYENFGIPGLFGGVGTSNPIAACGGPNVIDLQNYQV